MTALAAPPAVRGKLTAQAALAPLVWFKAGGAAASEQAAGILQLSQALGSGLLQGDELRSLRENAPLLAQAGTTLGNKAGTALTNEAGTALTNKAGTDLTNQAGVGLKNKGGATLDAQAPMVTVKASATGTVDGGGMLTVKGGLVKIN